MAQEMNFVPFGEYRPDVSNYGGAHSAFVQNVVPRADGYGPVRSPQSLLLAAGPPLSEIRGFFQAIRSDGVQVYFFAASGTIYANSTDVTRTGGYAALPVGDRWEFAQYNDLVIAVCRTNPPQVFDLFTSPRFADLGGSPPQAGAVAVFGPFLVLGRLANNPFRVQWSAIGNPQSWTPGTNLSDYEDLSEGNFVLALAPDGYQGGWVFQRNAVRRFQFVPGSDAVFQIDRAPSNAGLLMPYSVVRAGSRLFALSTLGFAEMTDGAWRLTGTEKVDRTFFAEFDRAAPLHTIHGAADGVNPLVMWTYRTRGSGVQSGRFDRVLVYNYVLDRWSLIETSGDQLAGMWGPDIGVSSLPYYNDALDKAPPLYVFRLTGGTTAALDAFMGTPLEAQLTTPELTLRAFRQYSDRVLPVTDATDAAVAAITRNRVSDAGVLGGFTTIDADGYAPFLSEGRYLRIRVKIPAGSHWSFASGAELLPAQGGRY